MTSAVTLRQTRPSRPPRRESPDESAQLPSGPSWKVVSKSGLPREMAPFISLPMAMPHRRLWVMWHRGNWQLFLPPVITRCATAGWCSEDYPIHQQSRLVVCQAGCKSPCHYVWGGRWQRLLPNMKPACCFQSSAITIQLLASSFSNSRRAASLLGSKRSTCDSSIPVQSTASQLALTPGSEQTEFKVDLDSSYV